MKLSRAPLLRLGRDGIEAMAAASDLRRTWPVLSGPAASLISIGLKDQSGRFLPGLIIGDRWFVVGGRGTALFARGEELSRFPA